MLGHLFINQIKRTRRYFRVKTAAKLITLALFAAVLALVAVGIYNFFWYGFNYVAVEDQVLEPLLLYFYELFFLVLGAMIFFSALVSGMFALWRGKGDEWFLATPNFHYLPKLIFIKTFWSGIWTLLIVLVPTVLALARVFELSGWSIMLIVLSFFVYLALINSLALLMIVIGGYILGFLSSRIKAIKLKFGVLFLFLLLIIMLFSILIWNLSLNVDLVDLFRADDPGLPIVEIADVAGLFAYLPSHPMAMITILAQVADWKNFFIYFIGLAGLAAGSILAWWHCAALFLSLWQRFREGGRAAAVGPVRTFSLRSSWRFGGGAVRSLFEKEFLSAMRNPRHLLWFCFLLFIWLIQAAINANLARNLNLNQLDPSIRQTAVQSLQFAVAVFFVSAFVLRFVFPLFSSDRRVNWVLASAPIAFRRVFYARYLFYAMVFLALGAIFGRLSTLNFDLDWIYVGETIAMFGVATLLITALGLSLGALFPNYDSDDPGAMSTTLPGLSLVVLSLLYGASGGLAIYAAQNQSSHLPIYLFIFFSALATAAILFFTPIWQRYRRFN